MQAIFCNMFVIFGLLKDVAGVTTFTAMWGHELFVTHVLNVYASNGVVLPNCNKSRDSMWASLAFRAIKDWFPLGYQLFRKAHGGPIYVMAQSVYSMDILVTLLLMHFLWLRAQNVSRDDATSQVNQALKKIMVGLNITNKTPQSQEEADQLVCKLSEWLAEQDVDFPEVRFPDFTLLSC